MKSMLQGKNENESLSNYIKMLTSGNIEITADNLLKEIGKYFQAERVYIFEIDQNREYVNETFEWCNEGIESKISQLQNKPLTEFNEWFDVLQNEGGLHVNRENTPKEISYLLERENIIDFLAVPLTLEGKVMGFLGVNNPKININHLTFLYFVSISIYKEILHKRENDLIMSHRRMRSDMEHIIQAVESTNVGVFGMYGFETGHPIVLTTPQAKSILGIDASLTEEDIYDYWFSRIDPAYIPLVLEEYKRMLQGETIESSYIWKHPQKGDIYLRYGSNIILTTTNRRFIQGHIADATESMRKEQETRDYQAKMMVSLQNALDEAERSKFDLQEQLNLVNTLSRDYLNIFLIDPHTGVARILKLDGYVTKGITSERKEYSYSVLVNNYIQNRVYPADIETLAKSMDLNTVLNELKHSDQYVRNYRVIDQGEIHYYQFKFAKIEGTENIIAAFQNVDAMIAAEMKENEQRNKLLTELKLLQAAIDRLYPRVSKVNLTRNTISNILMDNYMLKQIEEKQNFSEIINLAALQVPNDGQREEFLKHFSRENQIAAYKSGHNSISYVHQQLLEDGQYHWMETFVIFVEDGGDDIIQVALARCIDDDVKKQEELRDAMLQAESASVAKTTFLFNMSHDIRTPMNAILGFARLISKKIDDPEIVSDYVSKIEDSGEYLLSIINNVLDMARIESGKVELDLEPVNIGNKNSSVLDIFTDDLEKKHLTFTHDLDVVHPYVLGDVNRIKQILINLLSNAVKYTPEGGSIYLSTTEIPCEKEGYATYVTKIRDTGIGMSKEFLDQLFESFTRERTTTESKVVGTGLGMSIVKKLVDMMDGTIEVESEVGKGTTFCVTLTFKIVDSEDSIQNKEESTVMDSMDLSGRRILMAEDNDLNAEIVTEILGEFGIEVERTQDGVQCVDRMNKVSSDYYDLILMDIQMPNMNGYDATKRIRGFAEPEKANIPIIAMTANAFEEDRKNALLAGMNGHLSKPIDVSKMIKTFVSVLK